MAIDQLNDAQQQQLEAAVLRRLLAHLDGRKDVQNIELMNLAGFCRNCLSNWYVEAATQAGLQVDRDDARERVYGMPYSTWKSEHQREATPEQLAEMQRQQQQGGH
ncbi:MAG: DUF1244 domain-containing protein [Pseudomonadales bacterium]